MLAVVLVGLSLVIVLELIGIYVLDLAEATQRVVVRLDVVTSGETWRIVLTQVELWVLGVRWREHILVTLDQGRWNDLKILLLGLSDFRTIGLHFFAHFLHRLL
jgi:hypothetical protein